jgi:hypothetical protein
MARPNKESQRQKSALLSCAEVSAVVFGFGTIGLAIMLLKLPSCKYPYNNEGSKALHDQYGTLNILLVTLGMAAMTWLAIAMYNLINKREKQ